MALARVNGVGLHHEIMGQGKPVLYIGGTAGDLRVRPGVQDSPLARAAQVLAYDQRNLGQSDKPAEPCTMADYAHDAAGLMAAVGWERAPVVGFSFGAMVAQHLALLHPERVESLVLMCGPSGGAGGASFPLHEVWELPMEERARRMIELADTRLDAAWQAAHGGEMERLVAEKLASMELTAATPGGEDGVRRQLQARRGHDTWGDLERIAAPTLVCGGVYDGIAPVPAVEALAGRIPGAKLDMFQGGHLFFRQDPAAWPRMIAFSLGEG